MTTTFTLRRKRRRQRKRVLDIALSSLLLQRRPVARRVRVCARCISSPHHLLIDNDETLMRCTRYACVLCIATPLYTKPPRFFFVPFF